MKQRMFEELILFMCYNIVLRMALHLLFNCVKKNKKRYNISQSCRTHRLVLGIVLDVFIVKFLHFPCPRYKGI